MIVVADTTPLNYLILIDEVELLPALFGHVLIPSAVFEELSNVRTPSKVRRWMEHLPEWLEVRNVSTITNPLLNNLDPGEREAIQLALDLSIQIVLIDEAEGRHVAEMLHLQVRGTLGILARGAELGKTDLRLVFDKLQQTSFRLSPSVRDAFLKRIP